MTTGVPRTLTGPRLVKLRRVIATHLPLPCPHCNQPVQPWQLWDLDHYATPVALGGDDDHLRPAHRHCNRAAGQQIRAAMIRRNRERVEHHKAPGW